MAWSPKPHPRPRRLIDPALGPRFFAQGVMLMITVPGAPASSPLAGLPAAYCAAPEIAENLAELLNDHVDLCRERLAAEQEVT